MERRREGEGKEGGKKEREGRRRGREGRNKKEREGGRGSEMKTGWSVKKEEGVREDRRRLTHFEYFNHLCHDLTD